MTSYSNPIQPGASVGEKNFSQSEPIKTRKWGHTFSKIANASAILAVLAFTVALVAAAVFFSGGTALPVLIALGSVAALSGGGALIAKFFQERMAQKEEAKTNLILRYVPDAKPALIAFQAAVKEAKNINDPDSLEKIILAQTELLKVLINKKDETYFLDVLKEVNKILNSDEKPNAIHIDALMAIRERFEGKPNYFLNQHNSSLGVYEMTLYPELTFVEVGAGSPEIEKQIDPFFEGDSNFEKIDLGPRGLDLFWQEPDIYDIVSFPLDGEMLKIPKGFLKDVSRSDFTINGIAIQRSDPNGAEKVIRQLYTMAGKDEIKARRLMILCWQCVGITLKNDIQMRAFKHFAPITVHATNSDFEIHIESQDEGGIKLSYKYRPSISKIKDDNSGFETILTVSTEFEFNVTANDLDKGYGETSRVFEIFSR